MWVGESGEWYNIGIKTKSVNLEQSNGYRGNGIKAEMRKGDFREGSKPPAGFDKYPENRSPGGWKKRTRLVINIIN